MRYAVIRHTSRSKAEQGSLFIMVLLVLLILTGVVLSLMFVTDVEMQLGSTERTLAQTFYGAESGLHAALSGLPNQSWTGEEIAFVEKTLDSEISLGTRVRTTRIHAVGAPQVPPMTLANEGQNDYHTFSIAVRSVSERVGWPSDDDENKVPFYPDGDPRENDVVIQSRNSVIVGYLVSPVRTPASAEESYNDDAATRLSF